MHTYVFDVLVFPPQWLKMIIESIGIPFSIMKNKSEFFFVLKFQHMSYELYFINRKHMFMEDEFLLHVWIQDEAK